MTLPEALGRCLHLLSRETLRVSARGTGPWGITAVGGQYLKNPSVSLWSFTLLGPGMGQSSKLSEMPFPFPGVCPCPHTPPWWLPKMCWALPATPEGWRALQTRAGVRVCLCELQRWWGISTEAVVNPRVGLVIYPLISKCTLSLSASAVTEPIFTIICDPQ